MFVPFRMLSDLLFHSSASSGPQPSKAAGISICKWSMVESSTEEILRRPFTGSPKPQSQCCTTSQITKRPHVRLCVRIVLCACMCAMWCMILRARRDCRSRYRREFHLTFHPKGTVSICSSSTTLLLPCLLSPPLSGRLLQKYWNFTTSSNLCVAHRDGIKSTAKEDKPLRACGLLHWKLRERLRKKASTVN